MKYRKRFKWLVLVYCFIMSINCLGQNKLNRNQILDVARTHLQNHNNAPDVDSVKCDSSTTKLTLEIIDNSISQSYMIIFTKKTIEIKVYNIDTILYRSTFEYHESSFEKLKEAVNNYRLKKVEPYNYEKMVCHKSMTHHRYINIKQVFLGRHHLHNLVNLHCLHNTEPAYHHCLYR